MSGVMSGVTSGVLNRVVSKGMRTVLLASLRRNTRRYVASAVAVVIGVTFVIVTNAVGSATREGLTRDVGAPYANVDLVVDNPMTEEADALMARAREDGFPAATNSYAMEPVTRDGVQLRATAYVSEAATDTRMQWQELTDGRFPAGPGEALVDQNAAKSLQVGLGDVLTVGSEADAPEATVVGVVDNPGSTSHDLYLVWDDLRLLESSLWIRAVAWGGGEELASALAPESPQVSADEYVAQLQADIARGVDYLSIVALMFVAIALFVAVMVIANTFSILFAQRTRDFALLRCVGVTRRQLRRSVRWEALALGLAASALGVLVGMVTGLALVQLVGIWFDDIGRPAFSPVWIGGAMLLGTLTTLAAAWLPTRAVTRVAPLAALRPDTGVEVRSAAGVLRIVCAALLLAGGGVLLALAVDGSSIGLMLAGGTAGFLGVLLLGPLLVPALIRVAGRAVGDGPVRRLATSNAVRNPRRTATTAASLLVGVTLTTAVLTGLATSRTALTEEMDVSYPLDFTLSAVEEPLPPELLDRVRGTDGVADAVALPGTFARIGDLTVPLAGVAERPDVVRGPVDVTPADGVLHLSYDTVNALTGKAMRQWTDTRTVDVVVAGSERTLRVEQGDGWGGTGLVSDATLAALTATAPQAVTTAVWVRADSGADPEDLAGDLAALAAGPQADIDGGYEQRAWVDLQVDILTGAVVGLLGVAVVIALVGIGNTLGLSVLERSRENALLRAMGLTRRQLGRSMAVEGLLLSVVATLLGTAIGVLFAWIGVRVMIEEVVHSVPLTLPVGQLLLVVLVAAGAGLGACVLPARKASRVVPAAGLALD